MQVNSIIFLKNKVMFKIKTFAGPVRTGAIYGPNPDSSMEKYASRAIVAHGQDNRTGNGYTRSLKDSGRYLAGIEIGFKY